ncbi:MAG TPA: SDR family oxidoreductase [Mycobacteriales bacterium]|nr:SDR family oxidoreductase [Mycobacteriales bacterium]
MRIVIAGGHGAIGLRLGRALAARHHTAVGLIRSPEQIEDLRAARVAPIVLDLEQASLDDAAGVLLGADAVAFCAGAGPGSGVERKDTVDRAAAVLLADACEKAGVERYVQLSSMGVETVRDGATPEGADEVFVAYLRAKLAAEDDLRRRDLAWTVLRPGRLTDDEGTGRVQLSHSEDRGEVARDDVAAVLAALLEEPGTAGSVLELVGGDVPVDEAVAAVAAGK